MYRTRDKNGHFVEVIQKGMQKDLKLDSIVYLACEEDPLNQNGQLKEQSNLFVLGGTHYV